MFLPVTGALLLGLTIGPAAPGPPPLLRHIDLTVQLDPKAGTLRATASLTVENTGPVAIQRVPLLLNRLLSADTVRIDGNPIVSWRESVQRFVDFDAWQVTSVVVELPTPLLPGATATVTVAYHGRIAPYVETGMRYVRDEIAPAFTILREDALAFPSIGTLSIAENRQAPREDFTFEVRVTAPTSLTVANGAVLADQRRDGENTTWHYRSMAKVPFLLIAVAPYLRLEMGGITVFAFPQDSIGGRRVIRAALRGMEWLETRFGPPQPGAHLSVIEIPAGWGSQASATGGVVQTADAFTDQGELWQLYHELSHLWNARDVDLPSSRWNEGLATWLQYRLAGRLDSGFDADSAMEVRFARLREQSASDSTWRTIPLADYGKLGHTDRAYSHGAVAFALLGAALGEDEFDRRYRNYLQANWTDGVTLAGLREAMTDNAPAPVSRLFAEWIDTGAWTEVIGAAPSLAALLRQRP